MFERIAWLVLCLGAMPLLMAAGCGDSNQVANTDAYREALVYCEFMCRVTDDVDVGKAERIPPGMIVADAMGQACPVSYYEFFRSAHALRLVIAGKLKPPVMISVTAERRREGGFCISSDWVAMPFKGKRLLLRRSGGTTMPAEERVWVSVRAQHYTEDLPVDMAWVNVPSDSDAGRFLEAAWGQPVMAQFSDGNELSPNAVRVLWIADDDPADPVARFADVAGRPVDFQPSVDDLDALVK